MGVLSECVQNCVGGSIVGLSPMAEETRERAEKHEEVEGLRAKRFVEIPCASEFRSLCVIFGNEASCRSVGSRVQKL